MKVDELERLLTAYYEGNTDECEEERLKQALRTEELPEHLLSDKRIVLAMEDGLAEEVSVPAGLEDRLSKLIDEKDEEEPHFIRRNSDRRNWRWVMGIAATFLLLFGIGWGVMEMKKKPIPPTPQDTFTDPQDAYRVLQATLVDVSRNWQAGLKQMQEAQVQMCIINKEVKQELSK